MAQCIRRRVNLGAQPAAAASDGLRRPLFFQHRAGALARGSSRSSRTRCGLLRQGFKDPLPYTPVAPAAIAQVRHLEVSETVAQRVSSGHGPSFGFSPAGFKLGT